MKDLRRTPHFRLRHTIYAADGWAPQTARGLQSLKNPIRNALTAFSPSTGTGERWRAGNGRVRNDARTGALLPHRLNSQRDRPRVAASQRTRLEIRAFAGPRCL